MFSKKSQAVDVALWLCEEGGSEYDPVWIFKDEYWEETTLSEVKHEMEMSSCTADEVKLKFHGYRNDNYLGLRVGTLFDLYVDRCKGRTDLHCDKCGHEIEGPPDEGVDIEVLVNLGVVASDVKDDNDENDVVDDIRMILNTAFAYTEYTLNFTDLDASSESK